MQIDSKRYGGVCRCGREHQMATAFCVIEAGALSRFDAYLDRVGLSGKRCVIYDTNTYNIPQLRRPRGDQEIVLPAQGLHADEKATARALSEMEPDIQVLVAVGSGTIHDTTRYCAKQRGIPFVSVPTAASCDAFCSTVAAMTWYGFKKTLPGVAPLLVVADTDIIAAAPWYLTLSGIGDLLGKFTALADWKISQAVTGEEVCPAIYGMMKEALDGLWNNRRGLLEKNPSACESVIYGLVMSGLAMQMMGNSRPASGAEHHISHFIEVEPAALSLQSSALHGEKVGVGTVLAAREYHRLAQYEDISDIAVPYAPVSDDRMMEIFGARLCGACLEENQNDCLAKVTSEKLEKAWPEVRKIITGDIPTGEAIYDFLEALGAKRTLPDIEVPEEKLPILLDCSPLIRNRLTLMRIRRLLRRRNAAVGPCTAPVGPSMGANR